MDGCMCRIITYWKTKVDSEEFCDANDDQANYDKEMASFYDEIDVKDDPIFPLLECDQINQADPETIENCNIYI